MPPSPGGASPPPGTKLEKLTGRLQRGGFLPDDVLSFADLAADADRRLFRFLVSSPSHVLSRHLPAIKTTNYNLRPRAHGFTLPEKDTCNFIPWMLFERINFLKVSDFLVWGLSGF